MIGSNKKSSSIVKLECNVKNAVGSKYDHATSLMVVYMYIICTYDVVFQNMILPLSCIILQIIAFEIHPESTLLIDGAVYITLMNLGALNHLK